MSLSQKSAVGRWWGVDVASATLDLGCCELDDVETFDNAADGIERLVTRVAGGDDRRRSHWRVRDGARRPSPRRGAAGGRHQSASIAGLRRGGGAIGQDRSNRCAGDRPLPSENQRLLGDLSARRQQLLELRTAETNRRHQAARPQLQESIDAVLRVLDEPLAEVDRQLAELIRADAAWRERDRLLQSVKGLGPATSQALVADLPELGRLDHQQIAKLVGVAPLNRDSGKQRGRRIVFGGRASVRSALYMAAFNAMRCNPQIRQFYQRLRDAGKPYKVAITACMRKLLTILNAIIRDQLPWKNPITANQKA